MDDFIWVTIKPPLGFGPNDIPDDLTISFSISKFEKSEFATIQEVETYIHEQYGNHYTVTEC